jgi:hypothetical protein
LSVTLRATARTPTVPFCGAFQLHRICTVGSPPPPTYIRPDWSGKIRPSQLRE